MKARKPKYRPPQTSAEKIADARRHIESLQSAAFGQHGETYWNCVNAIKRWQEVIDRETNQT